MKTCPYYNESMIVVCSPLQFTLYHILYFQTATLVGCARTFNDTFLSPYPFSANIGWSVKGPATHPASKHSIPCTGASH